MCHKVSSQFNQVITTTPLLIYKIELGLGGYEDVPYSGLGVATKLNKLRNLHAMWNYPQPQIMRQPFDLPVPPGWRVENWMIVDGVFGIHSIAQAGPIDGKNTRLDLISLHDVATVKSDPGARRRTILFDTPSFNSVVCLHQQLVILVGDDEYVFVSHTYCEVPDISPGSTSPRYT